MRDGKLVAGQIGCGGFAWDQDIPNLKERDDVVVKYCCDAARTSAEKAAAEFPGAQAVTDSLKVLDDPEVDFVKVSTPHDLHKDIVIEAAKRGKHVFCEKPMAMELRDCWEMAAAVRRTGIKFCVDLNRRMAPALHALKARVLEQQRNERHSPWRYVETTRAPLAEEKNTHFLMRMQDESASYRMIHLDPMHGGGEILGETVHWLDLATWFFDDQRPVALTAWGSTRLTHGVNLKFERGDSATILFDACGTFDYVKERYEVTSRSALFQSLFFCENRYYGMNGDEREVFDLQHDAYKAAVAEDGLEGYLRKNVIRRSAKGGMKGNYGSLVVDKGHRAMLAGFIEAIKTGGPSPCDEYAGIRSILLARLCYKSIELGQTMPIPVEYWEPAFA